MTTVTADAHDTAVEFAFPMPGLSPYTAFSLDPIPGADGLYALRAIGADVRLFLLDPDFSDYGYEPRIPSELRAELGADDETRLRVLVVANPADDGVYVNLRAPIVLHPDTSRAAQVILDDESYPIRVRLDG